MELTYCCAFFGFLLNYFIDKLGLYPSSQGEQSTKGESRKSNLHFNFKYYPFYDFHRRARPSFRRTTFLPELKIVDYKPALNSSTYFLLSPYRTWKGCDVRWYRPSQPYYYICGIHKVIFKYRGSPAWYLIIKSANLGGLTSWLRCEISNDSVSNEQRFFLHCIYFRILTVLLTHTSRTRKCIIFLMSGCFCFPLSYRGRSKLKYDMFVSVS